MVEVRILFGVVPGTTGSLLTCAQSLDAKALGFGCNGTHWQLFPVKSRGLFHVNLDEESAKRLFAQARFGEPSDWGPVQLLHGAFTKFSSDDEDYVTVASGFTTNSLDWAEIISVAGRCGVSLESVSLSSNGIVSDVPGHVQTKPTSLTSLRRFVEFLENREERRLRTFTFPASWAAPCLQSQFVVSPFGDNGPASLCRLLAATSELDVSCDLVEAYSKGSAQYHAAFRLRGDVERARRAISQLHERKFTAKLVE